MKINRVAIAGPDDNTSIGELVHLSKEFPFVEWGILFSRSSMGKERYPSQDWIDLFTKTKADVKLNAMKASAHFCGAFPREILQKDDFEEIKNYRYKFDRFQINFNFKNTSFNQDSLDTLCSHPMINIILQYNKSNSQTILNQLTRKYTYFDILFDASGGRGTEIKTIEPPFANHYTGYAGGINPSNVESICELITNHENQDTVYIDLESGIRTDNQFDLSKVEELLTKVKPFITND